MRRGCTFSRLVWRATEADTLGEASRGASGNRGVVPPKNIHASDPPPCAAPERGCRSPPDPAPSFPGAPLAAPEEVTPPRLERAGQLPGNGERVRGPIKPTRCPEEAAPLGAVMAMKPWGALWGRSRFEAAEAVYQRFTTLPPHHGSLGKVIKWLCEHSLPFKRGFVQFSLISRQGTGQSK